MTAFVPDNRCGAVPDSHRIPSCVALYIEQTNNGVLYIVTGINRQVKKNDNKKKLPCRIYTSNVTFD
jgi:hypothetical protein